MMRHEPTLYIQVNGDIELRTYKERNASELFALIDQNRAYLRQWLPWVDFERSVADSRAFILNTHTQYANNEGFSAGIWYKGQLVGGIGYHPIDWVNHKVEIGYWLAEAFQGKGIMTNACMTLVTYAFEVLQLHKVEIHCAIGNMRSRAIPERLGFQQEGIIRDAGWLYDHFVDHVIYSMLANVWQLQQLRD